MEEGFILARGVGVSVDGQDPICFGSQVKQNIMAAEACGIGYLEDGNPRRGENRKGLHSSTRSQ